MNTEALIEQLSGHLDRLDRRRSLEAILLWLPRGLLGILLIVVLLAALSRLLPLFRNVEIARLAAIFGLLSVFFTIVVFLVPRKSLLEKARFADRKLQLLERASTAVELHLGHIHTSQALAQEQLSETLKAYQKVDIKHAIPLRVRSLDVALLVAVVFLLLGAILLPNKQNDLLVANELLKADIERQLVAIEELQEEITNNSGLSPEQKEELLLPLEEAAQELKEADPSREFAVAVLSETTNELRDLSEQNSSSLSELNLEEAAAPLARNQTSRQFGQSLQSGKLSTASAELSELSEQLPNLSEEELSNLARDLAETAANLQEINPQLAEELLQSAQQIQQSNTQDGQQSLEGAAETLRKEAQEQALSAQASQAADQLEESRQQVARAEQDESESQDSQRSSSGTGTATSSDQSDDQALNQDSPGQNGALQGAGGPGPGGGHTEQVFVPDIVDLSEIEGVDIELQAQCVSNPESCGALLNQTPTQFSDEESLVPYSLVFGDYRDTAYEALESDYIPLNMRNLVRDYFSSLEP